MPRPSSADKILDHATSMFAEQGFDGTIMDELAASAQVNKATIYYHFKDKETLYEEVLVRHFEAFASKLIAEDATVQDTIERLEMYINVFARESYKSKALTSILMREIAGGGDKMPNRAKAQMHRILLLVKSILTNGYNEGTFIKVDLLSIHFMILGSLSFYITSEPIRKVMVSSDADLQHAFVNSKVEDVALELCKMIKNAIITTKENR